VNLETERMRGALASANRARTEARGRAATRYASGLPIDTFSMQAGERPDILREPEASTTTGASVWTPRF